MTNPTVHPAVLTVHFQSFCSCGSVSSLAVCATNPRVSVSGSCQLQSADSALSTRQSRNGRTVLMCPWNWMWKGMVQLCPFRHANWMRPSCSICILPPPTWHASRFLVSSGSTNMPSIYGLIREWWKPSNGRYIVTDNQGWKKLPT